MSIRDDIRKSFKNAFKEYDLIIGPTTTDPAYDISLESADPSKSFMDDVLVIPVNMAGLPGMNIPMGFSNKLPVGLHIIGDSFDEARMYQFAAFLEKKLKLNLDPRGDRNE
jgi:aspartyl-tRNA(Asn)/glutamyl-tRNA(Gln) amidotransferase subunit A